MRKITWKSVNLQINRNRVTIKVPFVLASHFLQINEYTVVNNVIKYDFLFFLFFFNKYDF